METKEKASEIKIWEDYENKRSAGEAKKIDGNLLIADEIIERYSNPFVNTPYRLEYAYYLLDDVCGKTVLDYGCGAGDNCVLLASRGANVVGIDISPELLGVARKKLKANNLESLANFWVGSAHELPLKDESVDVVFGMAILHHCDLKIASNEVFRVLKKGGRAIFQEPVRNSKFVKFVRNLIPYEAPDISPFERPLTDLELREFARDFSGYQHRAFSLPFVNLIRVLGFENLQHFSIEIDNKILELAPFLEYYASIRVVEMTK